MTLNIKFYRFLLKFRKITGHESELKKKRVKEGLVRTFSYHTLETLPEHVLLAYGQLVFDFKSSLK